MDNGEKYDAPSAYGASILAKYGWEHGKGLGVNEDGIRTHLRVKKKADNAGIGATANRYKWDSMWWERAYNAAASNLEIGSSIESIDKNTKGAREQSTTEPAAADRRHNVVGSTAVLLAKGAPLSFQREATASMAAGNGPWSSRDGNNLFDSLGEGRAGLGARSLADESGAVLASKPLPAVDDLAYAPRGLGFGGPANGHSSHDKLGHGYVDPPSADDDHDHATEKRPKKRSSKGKARPADANGGPESLSEARRVLYSSVSFVRSHVLLPDGSSKSVDGATPASSKKSINGGVNFMTQSGHAATGGEGVTAGGGVALAGGKRAGKHRRAAEPITPHTQFDSGDEEDKAALISRDAELALGVELAKYEWGRWGGKRGKLARIALAEQEAVVRLGGSQGGVAQGHGHGHGHGLVQKHGHGHGHGDVKNGGGGQQGHGHGHALVHHIGPYSHVHGQFYPANSHHHGGGAAHGPADRKREGEAQEVSGSGDGEARSGDEGGGLTGAGEKSKKKRRQEVVVAEQVLEGADGGGQNEGGEDHALAPGGQAKEEVRNKKKKRKEKTVKEGVQDADAEAEREEGGPSRGKGGDPGRAQNGGARVQSIEDGACTHEATWQEGKKEKKKKKKRKENLHEVGDKEPVVDDSIKKEKKKRKRSKERE